MILRLMFLFLILNVNAISSDICTEIKIDLKESKPKEVFEEVIENFRQYRVKKTQDKFTFSNPWEFQIKDLEGETKKFSLISWNILKIMIDYPIIDGYPDTEWAAYILTRAKNFETLKSDLRGAMYKINNKYPVSVHFSESHQLFFYIGEKCKMSCGHFGNPKEIITTGDYSFVFNLEPVFEKKKLKDLYKPLF